jgi:hypothetical protein
MRGFFPLCHRFFSLWHYGIADQHMTTAIGGGFLSLNKKPLTPQHALCFWMKGQRFFQKFPPALNGIQFLQREE